MKSFTHLALALGLISGLASARSSMLPVRDVSPTLHTVNIQNVANEGKVLKTTHHRPFTNYLIGIDAEVNIPNACTHFVGTATVKAKGQARVGGIIRAVGSTDPTIDACIAVAVPPVKTTITFEMPVLTGGYVQAATIQKHIVEIVGAGRFSVILNIDNQTVEVQPAK